MLIAIIRIIGLKLMKVSPTLTLECRNRSFPLVSPLLWFSPFFQNVSRKNYSDLISPIYISSHLSYLIYSYSSKLSKFIFVLPLGGLFVLNLLETNNRK